MQAWTVTLLYFRPATNFVLYFYWWLLTNKEPFKDYVFHKSSACKTYFLKKKYR